MINQEEKEHTENNHFYSHNVFIKPQYIFIGNYN